MADYLATPFSLGYDMADCFATKFSLDYDRADCISTPCSGGDGGMRDQSMMSVVRKKTEEEASYCGSDRDFECGFGPDFDSDDEKVDDWNAGLLYARGDGVTLCLMDFVNNKFQNRARHIVFGGDAGTGFTMIESKLYAFGFGGRSRGSAITDFYVYDLENLRARKFKHVGKLLTPKTTPVVIPYDSRNNKMRKKMFIIPTGYYNDLHKDMSCEVIYLPCKENPRYELKRLITPFDKAYRHDPLPSSQGFTVSGKYAYIHLKSQIWRPEDRMFCLDMDADEFKICKRKDDYNDKSFPKGIFGLWDYMRCICRDKLFLVTWSVHSLNVKVYASSNLSEKQPIQESEEYLPYMPDLCLVRLKEVENFFNTELKDYHALTKSWTLPFDAEGEENAYSIFVCYITPDVEGRLLVCNFKLVESEPQYCSAAMDSDANARKLRYKCEILSHAYYTDFIPDVQWFVHAFTPGPGGNSRFPCL